MSGRRTWPPCSMPWTSSVLMFMEDRWVARWPSITQPATPTALMGWWSAAAPPSQITWRKYQYEVWKALARAYGTGSRELAFDQCNKAVSRAYLDGPDGGDALVKGVMDVTRRNVNADVFCDACDALIDMDMIPDLTRVLAPTLVMVGDEDVLTPADQGPDGAGGRFIYEHLDNARFREFVIIPSAGHANLMDNPEPSNRAVIDFLKRVESQAGVR